MARHPRNRAGCLCQAAVVFLAGTVMALMAVDDHFVSTNPKVGGYFIRVFYGLISLLFFWVGFILCYEACGVAHDDGAEEDVETGMASQTHAQQQPQRNQERDGDRSIRLPAMAATEADDGGADDEDECVVCLGKFRDDDDGMPLPKRRLTACRHVFHRQCIEQWLRAHPTCPICRCNVRQQPPEVVVVHLNT